MQPNTLLYRSENGGYGGRETESRSLWELVVLSPESSVIVIIFPNTNKEGPELKCRLHLEIEKYILAKDNEDS